MRSLLIASAGLVVASSAADAQQRPGTSYGMPGAIMQAPMASPRRPGPIAANSPVVQSTSQQAGPHRQPRWGSKIGGRWWAGANAPGSWAGYRRPHRGWAVPSYWNAPRFYVGDWSAYGLPQPPQGYNWARYYDQAVLIDRRGSVYDTVGDIDWDGDGKSPGSSVVISPRDYAANDTVYAGPSERGYAPRYDDRGVPRPGDGRYSWPDTGLGGAAIGAVAGGVAGNVIAGRGNRLGGTLIGAGVGAAAGYAIDKSEDRDRRAPPPLRSGYGAEYPPPPAYSDTYAPPRGYSPPPRAYAGDDAPPYGAGYRPPRDHVVAPGNIWVSPDGVTTVTTTSGAAHSAGSTTVVVQSVPMTTTTTTTEYYETVSYPRHKLRRR